jgi:4-hydroxybenzoate polyprenyltransferase
MSFFQKITDYLRLIKFAHSVFALPFAFTSALIAAEGVPTLSKIFWITIAMIGGRSGAMGMNRIIDRKIDALNPRTQNRELPRGIIKTRDALIFTGLLFIYQEIHLAQPYKPWDCAFTCTVWSLDCYQRNL